MGHIPLLFLDFGDREKERRKEIYAPSYINTVHNSNNMERLICYDIDGFPFAGKKRTVLQ